MKKNSVNTFIHKENQKIKKMNKIASDALKSWQLVTEVLQEDSTNNLTLWQRLADKVAEFGWSWNFIIIFGTVLASWIILNALFLSNKWFDPYPFILLNLILSCIAALQAPIIMMSQNRKEEIDRKRSENDYIINLKSEMQVRKIDQKIDMIITEHMKDLFKLQEWQLIILKEIRKDMKK